MPKRIDMTGKIYGHLTVLGLAEKIKGVRARPWTVSCASCGGSGAYSGSILRAGMVTSCGCKPRLNLRGFNLVKRMKNSGQRLCKSLPASASANPCRPAPLQILKSGSSWSQAARRFISWPRNLRLPRTNSRPSATACLPIRARRGSRHE